MSKFSTCVSTLSLMFLANTNAGASDGIITFFSLGILASTCSFTSGNGNLLPWEDAPLELKANDCSVQALSPSAYATSNVPNRVTPRQINPENINVVLESSPPAAGKLRSVKDVRVSKGQDALTVHASRLASTTKVTLLTSYE